MWEGRTGKTFARLGIRELYRQRVASKWEIIEKETMDEIIFRTTKNERIGIGYPKN